MNLMSYIIYRQLCRLRLIVQIIKYSILATLIYNILSIPTNNTDIEQLFNYIRNIYYYCQEQLKENTIKDLIIYLCLTKFEYKNTELDLIKEQLSVEETVLSNQKAKSISILAELDPISKNEKQEQKADNSDNSDYKLSKQFFSAN
ncbi:uncharacterized protein N7469_008983 [Penicillium citrinum]|uniref:Uncharacterized protein n=1 Tax=Penicillium citrinum TaxID=5077 RepID=A0A9W9NQ35_PENCI|nr:uncharacterized protein N7469_008983 [Penicillium citrinum]KAJ5222743.1 hypothetical protein N7469_008983 [Penicillium citrinum]